MITKIGPSKGRRHHLAGDTGPHLNKTWIITDYGIVGAGQQWVRVVIGLSETRKRFGHGSQSICFLLALVERALECPELGILVVRVPDGRVRRSVCVASVCATSREPGAAWHAGVALPLGPRSSSRNDLLQSVEGEAISRANASTGPENPHREGAWRCPIRPLTRTFS